MGMSDDDTQPSITPLLRTVSVYHTYTLHGHQFFTSSVRGGAFCVMILRPRGLFTTARHLLGPVAWAGLPQNVAGRV